MPGNDATSQPQTHGPNRTGHAARTGDGPLVTRQPHRLRAATDESVKLLMIEASPGFTDVRFR